MTASPTRLAMVGVAHLHADGYARQIEDLPQAELVGIYDADADRARAWAERHRVPAFLDLDELLAQGVDGALVCAENARHRLLVEALAGRVSAILCEKPLATSLEDGRAMVQTCQAHDTRLWTAFPVRFAPAVRYLKELVAEERLGRLLAAKCTNHGRMPGGWFTDPALAGGGAVMDHTVHVVDVLRWILGAEVVEVYAEVGEALLHPEVTIDDAGILSFRMDNGLYATLDASWSRPPSYPTWGDVKIELLGERGHVRVDALRQHLLLSTEELGRTVWVPWGSNMDRGLIRAFIMDIREPDRAPDLATGEDGLRALEVALAAYTSARRGEPVALPLS